MVRFRKYGARPAKHALIPRHFIRAPHIAPQKKSLRFLVVISASRHGARSVSSSTSTGGRCLTKSRATALNSGLQPPGFPGGSSRTRKPSPARLPHRGAPGQSPTGAGAISKGCRARSRALSECAASSLPRPSYPDRVKGRPLLELLLQEALVLRCRKRDVQRRRRRGR
jgi:hypothetical protein